MIENKTDSEHRSDTPQPTDGYLWDVNGDKIETDHDRAESHDDKTVTDHTESDSKEEDRRIRAESIKIASRFSTIGLFLLFALIFSYFIGSWMDSIFGTKPVLTLVWLCFGIAASVRETVRIIRSAGTPDERRI